jgi:hypothetical protein
MAGYLPGSGSLSMSTINSTFNSRGQNLNAYRGTAWYTAAGGSGTFSSGAITFNDFYLKGPSPAITVNINALQTATYTANYTGAFPVTASISFFSDGTYVITNNPATPTNANWATPTTAGVGSSYWISWTLVGVVGTNGSATASSGRVSLSTTRTIACNKTSGGTTDYTAEYDIEIWDAASGGTRVGYAPGFTLVASRI